MARTGRPTKLTKELQEAICNHLKDGLFRKDAAALVDLDEVTVSRWYGRGANDERGIFRDFYLAVNKAEAEFKKTSWEGLKAAAAHEPKHNQWYLTRRFPDQFARRDNVEVQSAEDKAANASALRELLLERLERLVPVVDSTAEPATPPALPAETAPATPPAPAAGSANA